MIDPNLLRNNLAEVAEKLKVKRNFILDTEKLTALEEQRKDLQVKTETLQAERNARSKACLLYTSCLDFTASSYSKRRGRYLPRLIHFIYKSAVKIHRTFAFFYARMRA